MGLSSAEGRPVLVIGAGPAGLTAAYELAKRGIRAVVCEQDDQVGGLARTVSYRGYRFDIGGHRFFTKVDAVQRLWEDLLGEDFLDRPRLSRIYYRDRFFDYPLRPLNALAGLGPVESVRILMSYVQARVAPHREERSFEEWVVNRFGRRLFEIFFRTYTEKVWGVPCSEIAADWAAQRIKNLDLKTAVLHALASGRRDGAVVTTLIDRFHYPRLGPGMMWERMRDRLASLGVETKLETEVVRLQHAEGRVRAVTVRDRAGEREVEVGGVISSMPLGSLVRALDPAPPPIVGAAADRLRHRDFLTVVLIVRREAVFPDNWIYVHSPDVRVGRIQNFKNWSPEMVPDPAMTALGLEYFVHEGDDLWSASDESLLDRGVLELERLGLVRGAEVEGGTVVRMAKAYPLYDPEYADSVATIRDHLAGISNLHTIGRNGQHRYNNQDHSMLTGLLAARVVAGEEHDVWDVNVDPEYHEEGRGTGRATPGEADLLTLEEVLGRAFARYDPVALGAAVGIVLAAALFVLTAVTLLLERASAIPLSLLGHYLYGYETTWTGALIGVAEGLALGFAWGYALALLINRMVGWQEAVLESELEAQSLDPLEES